MSFIVKAYAKINLWLDITAKRSDGYHELNTVMQRMDLYDTIEVNVNEDAGGKINITCDDPEIPCDERNIAYRACRIFAERSGYDLGADIDIKKRIPTGAGLGGSSTDGAAVLLGLNELNRYHFTMPELMEMAAKLGADVPFFVQGGTAVCTGKGEFVRPIKCNKFSAVIVVPEKRNLTADAYRLFDEGSYHEKAGFSDFCSLLGGESIEPVARDLYNIFDIVYNDPGTAEIKKALIDAGAFGACMTGSGSAVYGIFRTPQEAMLAAKDLPFKNVFAVDSI